MTIFNKNCLKKEENINNNNNKLKEKSQIKIIYDTTNCFMGILVNIQLN